MNPSIEEVDRFRLLVAKALGLHFDEGKRVFLSEVLCRRVAFSGSSVESYLKTLAAFAPRAEKRALAQELTVAETYFFRHAEQFQAFREVAIPARMGVRSAVRTLRILSAGCASGEEPYTLSMLVRDGVAEPGWDVSIVGIDVNPTMLEHAKRGRYGAWALRETPADIRGHYFKVHGREFVLDAGVRNAVIFEERNLVEDDGTFWRPDAFDVVFCRNVLMYFSPDLMRRIVARIARSLAAGGFLFLGHAETLRDLSQDFQLCSTHGTFYYQRHAASEPVSEASEASYQQTRSGVPVAAEFDANLWVDAIRRAAERVHQLTSAPRKTSARDEVGLLVEEGARWDPSSALDLVRQERFEEARALLSAVPPAWAQAPQVLLLRAVVSTNVGDLATTRAVCRELLHHDEVGAGAHYLMGLCLETSGDLRGAANHHRMASDMDGTFAMPRLHLGLLAGRLGDRDGARREFVRALALLRRESDEHLLLFGGGFSREALISLCRAQLRRFGGAA